jgi:hypothetical protein
MTKEEIVAITQLVLNLTVSLAYMTKKLEEIVGKSEKKELKKIRENILSVEKRIKGFKCEDHCLYMLICKKTYFKLNDKTLKEIIKNGKLDIKG